MISGDYRRKLIERLEKTSSLIGKEILGLKRAIFSLEGVGKEKKDDIKNLYQVNGVEDMKRWIGFLKKVRK